MCLEWSQLWQNRPTATCPGIHHGGAYNGLRLPSERKILPVYRASNKRGGGGGEEGLYSFLGFLKGG